MERPLSAFARDFGLYDVKVAQLIRNEICSYSLGPNTGSHSQHLLRALGRTSRSLARRWAQDSQVSLKEPLQNPSGPSVKRREADLLGVDRKCPHLPPALILRMDSQELLPEASLYLQVPWGRWLY